MQKRPMIVRSLLIVAIPHVRHDPFVCATSQNFVFICATWLICDLHTIRLYLQHNAFVHKCDMTHSLMCATWLIHSNARRMAHNLWRTYTLYSLPMTHLLSLFFATRDIIIHMCDMTHSYVWHESSMRVVCGIIIYMSHMTHPCVWHMTHDSFSLSIGLQHATASFVCFVIHVIHDTHTNTFFCNKRQHNLATRTQQHYTNIRIHSVATRNSIIRMCCKSCPTWHTYKYIRLQHATELFACVTSHVVHGTHTNTLFCNTRQHTLATRESITRMCCRSCHTWHTYKHILLQHATALLVCLASHVIHDTHINIFGCNTQQHYAYVLQVMSYMTHIQVHSFATRNSIINAYEYILLQYATPLFVCVPCMTCLWQKIHTPPRYYSYVCHVWRWYKTHNPPRHYL